MSAQRAIFYSIIKTRQSFVYSMNHFAFAWRRFHNFLHRITNSIQTMCPFFVQLNAIEEISKFQKMNIHVGTDATVFNWKNFFVSIKLTKATKCKSSVRISYLVFTIMGNLNEAQSKHQLKIGWTVQFVEPELKPKQFNKKKIRKI